MRFQRRPGLYHNVLPTFWALILFTQPKVGVDEGPIHLVEAGLPQQLAELGWHVIFDGHHQFEEINTEDDPPIGKLKNPRFVSNVCKAVAQAVGEHAKKGHLPLTLGGDHSLVCCTPIESRMSAIELILQARIGYGYHLRDIRVRPSSQCTSRRYVLTSFFGRCRKYPDACVVWVDAHADINTAETTDSGTSVLPSSARDPRPRLSPAFWPGPVPPCLSF